MRVIIVLFFMFRLISEFTPISALHAIPDPSLPYPIFSEQRVWNISWALDSTSLVFQPFNSEQGVLVDDLSWIRYDLTTEQLTASNRWQFQPELSAEEWEIFDPANGFILASPSGRYIVFEQASSSLITLGDRLTSEFHTTYRSDSFYGTDGFHAKWSEDETALALQMFPSGGGIPQYIYLNFEQGVPQLAVHLLRGLTDEFPVSGIPTVYDISADGDRLLIPIGEYDPGISIYEQTQWLLLWDSKNPSDSQLIPDIHEFTTAAFAPDDESKLLIVSDTGLLEYDLNAQGVKVLDVRLNALWVDSAIFSPDGRWIALMEFNGDNIRSGNYLYVVSTGYPAE